MATPAVPGKSVTPVPSPSAGSPQLLTHIEQPLAIGARRVIRLAPDLGRPPTSARGYDAGGGHPADTAAGHFVAAAALTPA